DFPERYKDLHLKDAFPVGRSLPTAYVNHHFNGQAPDHPIIIDFNNKHRWIVEIKNLSRADYITDGWTVIKKDLKLLPGAFIVFEKVKQYVLNTMVFKPNGMQVVDELKESGGNEDSQLQQHQAKNKPDVEISWILTDRFRFPINFTEEAGFGKLKEIDVKTERELFTKMPLHCEPSNNKNRLGKIYDDWWYSKWLQL
ncbi:hypothetical protein M8C21_025204, partial [Ambrosia artemisiifolia]